MICPDCTSTISDEAKRCPQCGCDFSKIPALGEEELALMQQLIEEELSPADLESLKEMARTASSAEEFANMVMVGPCPKCSSTNTRGMDEDPEYEDPFVAKCLDCGLLWCLECDRELPLKTAADGHWCGECEGEGCESCEETGGLCPVCFSYAGKANAGQA